MKQVIKFAVIGVINTTIDFGVLNLLMFLTSITGGVWYAVLKATSFVIASTNSYFWNKSWVFENKSSVNFAEYGQFLFFAFIGGVIDVSVASLVVNFVRPPFNFITPVIWANIAAVAGSVTALTVRFLSYKHIIFRER